MRRSKHYSILGMLICSIVILVGCSCNGYDGYQGKAFERKPDGSIGPTIAGVDITFASENGSFTHTVTTNNAGHYRIALTPQRYVVTATHPDYDDYSSAPGFFVVTGEGYQTGNIFMVKNRHVDLLMITTSLLEKEPDFEDVVNQYKSVLAETEDLNAAYIELDSDECFSTYGAKVTGEWDYWTYWREVRDVLREIIGITEASYIMILGGPLVVPRPVEDACCYDEVNPLTVPSDAWYIDFDNDQIVDEGLSISRLPDLSYNSSAIVDGLQTAIELHNEGGYTLDNEVVFSMNGYTTPPYGVCCAEKDAFFELMSTNDYIRFAGHGSPTAIYSNYQHLKISVSDMDSIDLQNCHPVIIAYFPCSAGTIYLNDPTLPYEFMKAGAAAYLGRTTTQGVPTCVGNNFPSAIEGGMRIGPALFQSMRQTVLDFGDTFKDNAGQICLYGDPTLKRR